MRVLFEEVVLDLPGMVDAQSVGQLDLIEGVLEQPVLGAVVPGAGELVLVEDPEFHEVTSSVKVCRRVSGRASR